MLIVEILRVASLLALISTFICFIGFALVLAFGKYWFFRPPLSLLPFLGLAAFVFWGEIWNLFFPLNHVTIWIIAAACAAVIALRWRAAITVLAQFRSCFALIPSLLALGLLFEVALFSLTPIAHFDSGLYHLTAIRWLNEHRLVPGLANLHERLGFNQSFFVLVASLNELVSPQKARQIANALVVFLSGLILIGFMRSGLKSRALSLIRSYAILLMPGIVFAGSHIYLSSPGPDVSVIALALLCTFCFFTYLAFRRDHDEDQSRIWAFTVVLACTLVIKFKLSYLVLGAFTLGLLFALLFVWGNLKINKDLIGLICLSGVAFAPWLARGYVSSGYPFFPASILGLPVDWKVPARMAEDYSKIMYGWAREPGKPPDQVLGNYNWLRSWIETNAKYPTYIRAFVLISAGLICSILSLLIRSSLQIRLFQTIVLAPGLAALLFWFLTLPDPRYGEGMFLVVGLSLIFSFLLVLEDDGRGRTLLFTLALALFLATTDISSKMPLFFYVKKAFPQKIGSAVMVPAITSFGARLLLPAKGEPFWEQQTWDAPLPCAPRQAFNPNLEMRGPTLDDGFRTHRSEHYSLGQ